MGCYLCDCKQNKTKNRPLRKPHTGLKLKLYTNECQGSVLKIVPSCDTVQKWLQLMRYSSQTSGLNKVPYLNLKMVYLLFKNVNSKL